MPNKGVGSLKKMAIELAQQPTVNFYDLAALIVDLHGKEALHDFPMKTGMSRRRLYYLLQVGQFIEEFRVSKEKAEQVGWTKLQIIARHVRQSGGVAEDVAKHIDLALETRVYVLRQALTGQMVEAKPAIVFRLGIKERAKLTDALLACGAKHGSHGLTNKNEALMALVHQAMKKQP